MRTILYDINSLLLDNNVPERNLILLFLKQQLSSREQEALAAPQHSALYTAKPSLSAV